MTRGSTSTIVRVGIVLSVAALVVATACDALTIPQKDCHGTRVNRFDGPETGTDVTATGCARCLNDNCCDEVGRCEETPGCPEDMFAAHVCVTERSGEEASCLSTKLREDRGRELYRCMRTKCGPHCGVPHCDTDRAAVLFQTPDCDQCVTASCCEQINSCYENRRCKLILECIVNTCGERLGPSLAALRGAGFDKIQERVTEACTPGRDQGPEEECIRVCLDGFATDDGGPKDDIDARCRAFKVYACAARPSPEAEGCGRKCSPDAAVPPDGSPPPDASIPDAPSDALVDAPKD